MSATDRRLRSRKEIFYGIPPAPWLPSKPQTPSRISKTKQAVSRSSAKTTGLAETRVQPATSGKNQSACEGSATEANGESSHASVQEAGSDAESMCSVAMTPFKRARSATVQGDDEAAAEDAALTNFPKRRRTCEPSLLYTPSPTSAPKSAELARSNLSPATEAAIQQMPKEIKKAIKSLKTVRRCVKGLLEFKAILDHQQMEICRVLENTKGREMDATTG